MKKVILLSLSILLISLGYAFAEVPCKINYQGRLIKDNVPVDGTKTMRFSIHDSLQGGNELWTSGNVNITVYNGLFRYVLGSNGGDLSSIDWTAGQELYLEVEVETEILSPREELYAYPYAINSHLLEGKTTDYFLNASADTQTKQGDLNIMGNVGIGTTVPNYLLALEAAGTPRIRIKDTTNNVETQLVSMDTIGWVGTPSAHDFQLGTGGSTKMTIDISGNVGIGTTSPGAKLDVQGGAIKATGGLIIETGTTDPTTPATGRMWLRTDINP